MQQSRILKYWRTLVAVVIIALFIAYLVEVYKNKGLRVESSKINEKLKSANNCSNSNESNINKSTNLLEAEPA
jgi:hypothetical protein